MRSVEDELVTPWSPIPVCPPDPSVRLLRSVRRKGEHGWVVCRQNKGSTGGAAAEGAGLKQEEYILAMWFGIYRDNNLSFAFRDRGHWCSFWEMVGARSISTTEPVRSCSRGLNLFNP